MKTVSFTEFRRNAAGLFSDVEKGQIVVVQRHGRSIARITRISPDEDETPSWKRPGLRLAVKGDALSSAILEERNSADIP